MIKVFDKLKDNFNKRKNNNKTICYCFNVSSKDIVNQVNQGCESIKDIRNNTKAGVGCGRCNASLERITYKAIKNRKKNT